MKTAAEKSLEITSLFEAEVLVQLMLWRWDHPLADDKEFANALLENASNALRDASQGQQFIEGVPAADLNLIAALWYAESCAVQEEGADDKTLAQRTAWLSSVRRALPSCFCDPSDLHDA